MSDETQPAREPFDFLSLDPKKHKLFFDHDGTVAPFVVDAKTAFPPKEFVETLQRLQKAGFDISFVSGRPIEAPRPGEVGLDTFYAPLQPSASGLHGFEFRGAAGAKIQRPDIEPIGEKWWEKAEQIAREHGAMVEPKGSSHLGFHVRQIGNEKDEQKALDAFVGAIQPFLEANPDYKIQPGHKVVEICPDGTKGAKFDKGHGIARFMSLPENQGKIPVFFGDDGARIEQSGPKKGTDEFAFEEVRKYEAGGQRGIGVLVGAENDNPDCTSVATHKVASPQDLWAGFKTLAEKWAPAGPAPDIAVIGGRDQKPAVLKAAV